jgi:hypothetical protein
MSFGDFMGLVAAMGGLVAITAIFASLYRRRLEHKERIAEIKAGAPAQPLAPPAELERLEHRLRVLERIATDKTTSLAAQIEDLRQPVN